MYPTLNIQIAMKLQQMAELLEQQGANPFRVNAYRRASTSLSELKEDLPAILDQEGLKGLIALPNVGKGIATASPPAAGLNWSACVAAWTQCICSRRSPESALAWPAGYMTSFT